MASTDAVDRASPNIASWALYWKGNTNGWIRKIMRDDLPCKFSVKQADRGCTTEAMLCHGGSTIFCIVWYIVLYLDRLLVNSFKIEGE